MPTVIALVFGLAVALVQLAPVAGNMYWESQAREAAQVHKAKQTQMQHDRMCKDFSFLKTCNK